MPMLNNYKVRSAYTLEEILKIAYRTLARDKEVPFVLENNKEYRACYQLTNKEGKIITNPDEVTVAFYLSKVEPEKPYQAGDWKDPEVEKILND